MAPCVHQTKRFSLILIASGGKQRQTTTIKTECLTGKMVHDSTEVISNDNKWILRKLETTE